MIHRSIELDVPELPVEFGQLLRVKFRAMHATVRGQQARKKPVPASCQKRPVARYHMNTARFLVVGCTWAFPSTGNTIIVRFWFQRWCFGNQKTLGIRNREGRMRRPGKIVPACRRPIAHRSSARGFRFFDSCVKACFLGQIWSAGLCSLTFSRFHV